MKPTVLMPEGKLVKRGVAILSRELGAIETARFLSLLGGKRTDSIKRHRAWQAKLAKDGFFKQVFTSKP